MAMGVSSMLASLKSKAKVMKKDVTALYLAYGSPLVPWYAKLLVAAIVGYALSPIDLIPDFIPILGYLDDVLLIPLGITLAVKLIPKDVMEQCRREAQEKFAQGKPQNWIAGVIILLLWAVIIVYVLYKIYK